MKTQKKQRILWWSDTPVLELGYSQVAKQILKDLYATGEYEITIVGINQHVVTYYDRDEFPYEIHSPIVSSDVYNTKVFETLLRQGDYDILFTLQNINYIAQFTPLIMEMKKKYNFKWIVYTPIDTDNLDPQDVTPLIACDFPVSYTQFGVDVIKKYLPALEKKMSIINHGCEPDLFKPLSREKRLELRKKIYGIDENTFVLGTVNRNQWRKDMPTLGVALKEFKKYVPNALLLLHCKPIDIGGDLRRILKNLGLKENIDFKFSNIESEAFGVEREEMNKVFNCFDVTTSTTVGEGWGLAITESFAAGVPVVYPNHSSVTEIIGKNEERGYLADINPTPYFPVTESYYWYYFVNVQSLVNKWLEAYNDIKESKVQTKLDNALEYANNNTWRKVNRDWVKIFKKAQRKI